MSVLEAFIFGLVQGVTEFLPVSSSGHLILASKILGTQMSIGFELVCHLGTLLAIVVALRADIFGIIKKPLGKPMRLILVACIPTVIIVVVFEKVFRSFFSGDYLIYAFIITAILLLVSGFGFKSKHDAKPLTYKRALIIGAAQGFAAIPGISRSGATIATASVLGIEQKQAARFSLLISIPVIIGSSAIELITRGAGDNVTVLPLLIGLVTSFLSGLVAIKLLLKILQKFNLDAFSLYLFALSMFMLINQYALHLF